MTESDEVKQFLALPIREYTTVSIHNGWVEIEQATMANEPIVIQLCASDAYAVAKALRKAAREVRSQGFM